MPVDTVGRRNRRAGMALAVLSVVIGGGAAAQEPAQRGGSTVSAVGARAGEIASQPVRDVGLAKADIPPLLVAARADTYGLKGLGSCVQLAAALKQLDEILGPDFDTRGNTKENRAAKLAEGGGKAVVGTILPFRSLVREVSGAAPAERQLAEAIDAGFARRGFVRGLRQARNCRP